MRKLVLTYAIMAVLLVAIGAYAGALKRFDRVTGTVSYEVDGADSTGVVSEAGKVLLSTPHTRTQTGSMPDVTTPIKKYNQVLFTLYAGNMLDPGDSCTETYNDTCITILYAGSPYHKIALSTDTITLPGTVFVNWKEMGDMADLIANGAKVVQVADSASDSAWAGAYWQPATSVSSKNPTFYMDYLWFDYYCSDTAGTSGNLTGTLNYEYKLIEDN